MPAGTRITLCIGAANRDPAQFPDPDRLDVARNPNRHLAFGSGPHQCAGMHLARLEGRVAIGRFLARFPNYTLSGEPLRGGRARFRGFLSTAVFRAWAALTNARCTHISPINHRGKAEARGPACRIDPRSSPSGPPTPLLDASRLQQHQPTIGTGVACGRLGKIRDFRLAICSEVAGGGCAARLDI